MNVPKPSLTLLAIIATVLASNIALAVVISNLTATVVTREPFTVSNLQTTQLNTYPGENRTDIVFTVKNKAPVLYGVGYILNATAESGLKATVKLRVNGTAVAEVYVDGNTSQAQALVQIPPNGMHNNTVEVKTTADSQANKTLTIAIQVSRENP